MALTQFAFGSLNADVPAFFVAGSQVESEAPSGSSVATTATATATQTTCRVATDTAVYVSFGPAPNASSDTIKFFMPAGSVEYFRISSGNKAAVVTA